MQSENPFEIIHNYRNVTSPLNSPNDDQSDQRTPTKQKRITKNNNKTKKNKKST